MSAAFTPGPWTAYEFGADWWVANAGDDSGPMLRVGSDHAQREANAYLIAAAPDLYAALETIVKANGGVPFFAAAALAKARGEPPAQPEVNP